MADLGDTVVNGETRHNGNVYISYGDKIVFPYDAIKDRWMEIRAGAVEYHSPANDGYADSLIWKDTNNNNIATFGGYGGSGTYDEFHYFYFNFGNIANHWINPPVTIDKNGIIQSQNEAWKNATLANGWANFGGGYGKLQYRKENKRVYLRGLIRHTSYASTKRIIMTLPTGYRPSFNLIFNQRTGITTYKSARLDITSSGEVMFENVDNGYTGTNVSWLSLSGINFAID